jgi:hypothetical protein
MPTRPTRLTRPTRPTSPTRPTRPLVSVKRALVYTHRWLGIAGSVLFIAWFISGVVMMYARMPRLTPEDRLMRLQPLDLSGARIDPGEAVKRQPKPAARVRIAMLNGRVVYRLHDGTRWTTVFADTGETLPRPDPATALAHAQAFVPEHAGTMRYDARIEAPDQWTLQVRNLLPAHRIAVGDERATVLYISDQTGEPVLETTRTGRVGGYLGAVFHWIYFTPIRRNGSAWTQLIIWTSIAGSFLCLTGLGWGVWRYSSSSRYRLRGVPHSHSPYAGMMRWHHYCGLVFGLFTFTWVFSGLLSMNPWDWSPETSATRGQRDAFSGGPPAFDSVTLASLRRAAGALGHSMTVKEIELLQFRGELVAESYRAPEPARPARPPLDDPGAVYAARVALDHALVSLAHPDRGLFTAFDKRDLESAARAAMPGAAVADLEWLSAYDAYYYDRDAAQPLPVLRVRFADPVETWLYADPARGVILRREERLTRLNRWLYHGLHSLDFPWLYNRRPLWDVVVIVLSAGGLVVSVTSTPAAWRRLARHGRHAIRLVADRH